MTGIGLRPATAADSAWCYELHRTVLGPYVEAIWGWDEDVQRGFHDREIAPADTSVVTVDGADAGVLVVQRHPGSIYLARIEIHPGYQGRGVGGALVGDLLAEGAARGVPVELDVLHLNHRAHALYRRLGFRDVPDHHRDGPKIRMRAGVATALSRPASGSC